MTLYKKNNASALDSCSFTVQNKTKGFPHAALKTLRWQFVFGESPAGFSSVLFRLTVSNHSLKHL